MSARIGKAPPSYQAGKDPRAVALEVAAADLRTEIWLRDCVHFWGTWQQLIDEGVLPVDALPPEHRQMLCETHRGFSFSVARRRPPGFKGPYRDWCRSGDYWHLILRPIGSECSYYEMGAARLKAEADRNQALVRLLLSSDPEAEQFRRSRKAAATDRAFQKMLGEWVKSSKAVAREMLA